ncbi:MAG: hypothetical protein HQ526_10325 [Actinobacteria bacterium]|nr:hypothetical protein [Actinomycetota bacterium]
MKRPAIIFSVAICLLSGLAQAENWCQWFPSECQVFAYLNTKALRQVPMVTELLNGQDKASQFIGQIRQWTAIDLDSITDAWVGFSGNDDVVVVLKGAYNLSVIRGTVGAIETFRITTPPNAEFAVLMPDDKKPGTVNMLAFVTDTIMVFGKPNRVEGVLQNRDDETKHPRGEQLAALEQPAHILDSLIFGIPDNNGKVPAILTQNLALAKLTADANTNAEISLTLQPTKPDMVAPLQKLGEGLIEVYGQVPTDQVRLDAFPKVLLGNAKVTGTPESVVISTAFPLAMVRGLIAAKLGGGQP